MVERGDLKQKKEREESKLMEFVVKLRVIMLSVTPSAKMLEKFKNMVYMGWCFCF